MELRDVMVQVQQALLAADDAQGDVHAHQALAALNRMVDLNYKVFVGMEGMPPISESSDSVVRVVAATAVAFCLSHTRRAGGAG